MLFQLLVPHDFKDTARQLDQVVLVVDATTANLPWELMLADDPTRSESDQRPLALRMAVVRQLSSTRFRRRVRQNIERTALVVGNPSVKGFAEAFSTPAGPRTADPPDLPGAQAEADAVARLLGGMGYAVNPVPGGACGEHGAVRAVPAFLAHPAHLGARRVRLLHHADGRLRSGVVLSDGLLITAAEIGAMEVVPDARVPQLLPPGHRGRSTVSGNRLAASVVARAHRHRRPLRRRGRLGRRRRAAPSSSARPSTRSCCCDASRSAARCSPRAGRVVAQRAGHHLGCVPGLRRPGLARRAAVRGRRRTGRAALRFARRRCSTSWRAGAPSSRAGATT